MSPRSDAIFICGTDTNIGKTLVSALLVKVLNADYWKPVQCGDLHKSDTDSVRKLVGPDHKGVFHPERYALGAPQSPHLAAKLEEASICLKDFHLPASTNKTLIVEGAGGCLAPLNDREGVLDLAGHFRIPTILVTRFYLGAYNHTLLSIEAARSRGIEILGLILNGGDDSEFRTFITRKTNLEFLGIIPELAQVDAKSLEMLANEWREHTHDRIVRKRS